MLKLMIVRVVEIARPVACLLRIIIPRVEPLERASLLSAVQRQVTAASL